MTFAQKHLQAVTRALVGKEAVPIGELLSKIDKLNTDKAELLAACEHGAASIHHPSCSHGKSGDGNTCECHVKKCQAAIAKATA